MAKEFAEIGDASAQEALKQEVESWQKTRTDELSGSQERFSSANWELLFAVASEFKVDDTYLQTKTKEVVEYLQTQITRCRNGLYNIQCLKDGTYDSLVPPDGGEITRDDKVSIRYWTNHYTQTLELNESLKKAMEELLSRYP